MSEWINIEANCTNCGKPLAVKRAERRLPFTIDGFEPLDARHADGTTECVIRRKPEFYDICHANRLYKEAVTHTHRSE